MSGPLTWAAVYERPAPRVFRHFFSLEVRSAPAINSRRTSDQRLQPLLGCWIYPSVEFVDIEHSGKPFDRLVRYLFLGGAELPQRGRRDKANQQSENGKDDEQLEQGEPALLSLKMIGGLDRAERNDLRIAHAGRPGVFSPVQV